LEKTFFISLLYKFSFTQQHKEKIIMFRLVVLFKDGEWKSQNFDNKEEAETFVLGLTNIKIARLRNNITKEEETIWKE